MKRILSLVLLLTMLLSAMLSMTACSDSSEFNGAITLTRGLTSLDADIYTKVKANIGSKAQEYELVEKALISGDKVQLTKGEYGSEGQTVYMDGDFAYTKGDNGYTKVSLSEYIKENGSCNEKINGFLVKFPSSFFEDSDISKTGKKLTLVKDLDTEALTSTFGTLTDLLEKELDLNPDEPEKVEYKDCKLSLTVKDGYVTEVSLSYNMMFTQNKKKCTINVKTALYVNNPGSDVTVEIPQ